MKENIQRIKAKKRFYSRLLCRIRWERIKDEKIIWFLLICSILFPIIPFSSFVKCNCFIYSAIHSIITNVSYSYVAGVVFYVFSDFRPETKQLMTAKVEFYRLFRSINTDFILIASKLGMLDANGNLRNHSDAIKCAKNTLTKKTIQ